MIRVLCFALGLSRLSLLAGLWFKPERHIAVAKVAEFAGQIIDLSPHQILGLWPFGRDRYDQTLGLKVHADLGLAKLNGPQRKFDCTPIGFRHGNRDLLSHGRHIPFDWR